MQVSWHPTNNRGPEPVSSVHHIYIFVSLKVNVFVSEALIASLCKALEVGLVSKNIHLLKGTLKQLEDLKARDSGGGLVCRAKEMVLLFNIKEGSTDFLLVTTYSKNNYSYGCN